MPCRRRCRQSHPHKETVTSSKGFETNRKTYIPENNMSPKKGLFHLEGPRKRVHFSCVKAVPFLGPLICLKVAPGTQTGKSSCLCGGHLGGLVCSAWKLSSRPFLIGFCGDAASTVLNSKSLWVLAKILLRLFGANRRGTAATQIQSRNWCSGSKIC